MSITLEQAAALYAPNNGGLLSRNAIQRQADFIAGAKWQKEQDKEILEALAEFVKWHEKHDAISFIDKEILEKGKLLIEKYKL